MDILHDIHKAKTREWLCRPEKKDRDRADRKEEMMNRPIRFGKHKGTLYRDIEPQYLKWLAKTVEGHEWLVECLK